MLISTTLTVTPTTITITSIVHKVHDIRYMTLVILVEIFYEKFSSSYLVVLISVRYKIISI